MLSCSSRQRYYFFTYIFSQTVRKDRRIHQNTHFETQKLNKIFWAPDPSKMGRGHPIPIPQPHRPTLPVCSGVSIQRLSLTEIIIPTSCPDLKNKNIFRTSLVCWGTIFICHCLKILHFFNSSASLWKGNILQTCRNDRELQSLYCTSTLTTVKSIFHQLSMTHQYWSTDSLVVLKTWMPG